MSDFTDEDVAAARQAHFERGRDRGYRTWLALADSEYRAILAAVLPAHDKRVRAEALREAADDFQTRQDRGDFDPWYWSDVADILRARADAEEGK